MTPERYQRINALADSALEFSQPERLEFLKSACSGDPELLREVQELLRAENNPEQFLRAPLLEQLARDIVVARAGPDLAGKQFQNYQVLSRLGSGGIGEVWLAKDVRLGRQVALKLLSPLSAADPTQIQRFQREARTASSLNHPNIVTIYEIGTAGEFEFLAQEVVEGDTVRKVLAAGPMPLGSVLEVGTQAASALAAAHGAGIVHRDIKPENIMLRPDGLVKVLDFGLARFVERSRMPVVSETTSPSITRSGLIVGTAKYMSPEQARGTPVDMRSDVFSLGVVLYELATGRAPFSGQTSSDVIAAILAQDPEPVSHRVPGVPPEFEAVLQKCLEKDPDMRYATARDLQIDLELLLHNLRFPKQAAPSEDELPTAPGKTARLLVAGSRTRKRWQIPLLAVIVFAVLAGAWLYWTRRGLTATAAFGEMAISRIITRGAPQDAAISPDGALVAYFLDEPGGQSLWVRGVVDAYETRILAPEPDSHSGLAFARHGGYLTWRRNTGKGMFALYRMQASGGDPIRLRDDLNSAFSFSPAGDWYAYFQIDPVSRQSALMVASTDGSSEHAVVRKERPHYFSRYGLTWSPDGHYIACFEGEASAYTDRAFHLAVVRVSDGAERVIGNRQWLWGGAIAWPVTGTLFFTATEELDDAYQVWMASVDSGSISRVTNDLSSYGSLHASSDGRTMIALETQSAVELWVAPQGDSQRAVQISSGNVRSFNSLAWTRDGRIVYSALGGAFRNVWMVSASGGDLTQITSSPGHKHELAVTPDGRFILYHSLGNIWRMNLDGSHPKRLTFGADDVHPEPSHDGRDALYASFRDWSPGLAGKPTLWRVPIAGGPPKPVSDIAASVPKLSPDGKLIACEYFPGVDPQLSPHYIAILNADTGSVVKVIDQAPVNRSFVSWAPDSEALEYGTADKRGDNIWRWPLFARAPHRITTLAGGLIAAYAWSPDGDKLAVARANTTKDIVLIRASHK